MATNGGLYEYGSENPGSIKCVKFVTSWATVRFSRTLIYGVRC